MIEARCRTVGRFEGQRLYVNCLAMENSRQVRNDTDELGAQRGPPL